MTAIFAFRRSILCNFLHTLQRNERSWSISTKPEGGGGGGGRGLVKFSYQNHPTKIDVTSGQIGTQQPVSAKSNDDVWVRHDFFGFFSHRYQEL